MTKRDNPDVRRQFLVFLVVGGLNTAFGYGIYAALIYMGLHYALAVLLATVLGVLFNFKTTGTIVFASQDNSLIVKFFGVYAILFVFNAVFIHILRNFSFNDYVAGAITIPFAAVLSFILNKKLVFRQ